MTILENKYNARMEEIKKELQILTQKLEKHEQEFQNSNKVNWGYLGDLVHLDEELKEINQFMQID